MQVGMIVLGCDKNTVDAEHLAGLLEDRGCEVIAVDLTEADEPLPEGLDAAIVLTCGFIGDAKQQSVDALVRLAEEKRLTGHPRRLFAAGCLAQRYARELATQIPEIDGVTGVGRWHELAARVADAAARPAPRIVVHSTPAQEQHEFMRRRRLDSKPYAFLKIADGCNHACAFCAIPLMKGRLHSAPPDVLLREARDLLDHGVREIGLVAQDISVYGEDRGREYRLPQLVRDLCALDGDFWVRLLYCYPTGVTDALIEVMATEPKVVPYLDVPLQHLDPDVLRRMKRPGHNLDAAALVSRLRDAIPNITLRTTMLVGFPGETAAAHRRMIEGLRRLRFERLGAFQYSREEDTAAAAMPRQVGLVTREKRWHAVMQLQAELSEQWNKGRIRSRTRVLIEDYDAGRKCWVGRSPAEAPEVDGVVYVQSEKTLESGLFVDAEITQADTYDVWGHAL